MDLSRDDQEKLITVLGIDVPHINAKRARELSKRYLELARELEKQEPHQTTREEDFWKYIEKLGPEDCWNWRGGLDKDGYGHKFWNGKTVRSNRLALALSGVDVPDRVPVLQTCGNKLCCNPKHMVLTDWTTSQRQRRGGRYSNKLTRSMVQAIRDQLADGARPVELAKLYRVSASLISQIKHGRH